MDSLLDAPRPSSPFVAFVLSKGIDKVTAQDFNCSSGVLRTAVPHGGAAGAAFGRYPRTSGWGLTPLVSAGLFPPTCFGGKQEVCRGGWLSDGAGVGAILNLRSK